MVSLSTLAKYRRVLKRLKERQKICDKVFSSAQTFMIDYDEVIKAKLDELSEGLNTYVNASFGNDDKTVRCEVLGSAFDEIQFNEVDWTSYAVSV